jgi:hypothetical protein
LDNLLRHLSGDRSHDSKEGYTVIQTDTSTDETSEEQPVADKTLKDRIKARWALVRKNVSDLSAKYPNAPDRAMNIADMLVNYSFYRTKWSLAKGIFSLAKEFRNNNLLSIGYFCHTREGWKHLSSGVGGGNVGYIFYDAISQFPKQLIALQDKTFAELYELPMGQVVCHRDSQISEWYIYYQPEHLPTKTLLSFLAAEQFKLWKSNFFFILPPQDAQATRIVSAEPKVMPSGRADEIVSLIKGFNNIGSGRSLFLYGPPGTGKTSLSFTVLAALGYRTLSFSAGHSVCKLEVIKDIIGLLGIEAVIIDDFDQDKYSAKQLETLEYLNRHLKVLIGIANSLRDFHPAVLRPGRFDEMLYINSLDTETIMSVLGNLSGTYYEGAKGLPIAYINEFKKKAQFLDTDAAQAYLVGLNERADNASKRLNTHKRLMDADRE